MIGDVSSGRYSIGKNVLDVSDDEGDVGVTSVEVGVAVAGDLIRLIDAKWIDFGRYDESRLVTLQRTN